MVNEFLGEGVPHRQPAVPQTFNMASLLNEIQTVPHHHHQRHHQPPPGALQQQGTSVHDGEAFNQDSSPTVFCGIPTITKSGLEQDTLDATLYCDVHHCHYALHAQDSDSLCVVLCRCSSEGVGGGILPNASSGSSLKTRWAYTYLHALQMC